MSSVQCVYISAPTGTCDVSGLIVQKGGGVNPTLQTNCANLRISTTRITSISGPAANLQSVVTGQTTNLVVEYSRTVDSTPLITVTDLTLHNSMAIRHCSMSGYAFSFRGSLTAVVTDFEIRNCTSSSSFLAIADTAQYSVQSSRMLDCYSEQSFFFFGSISALYSLYNNITFQRVASAQSIWRTIGNARAMITNCRFDLRNISMPIIVTSSYHFNFSNIDLTGSFKTFVDGSPTLPFVMVDLNFHDIVCQGLIKGNYFALSVVNSTFSNVTVINASLAIQGSMTIVFSNILFKRFKGPLLSMSQTTFTFQNATFENCGTEGSDSLITSTQTTGIMRQVVFTSFTGEGPGSVLNLLKSSVFELGYWEFSGGNMLSGAGYIAVSQSNLTLLNSSIQAYNSSFIEASLSSIVLEHCIASEGGLTTGSTATINGGFLRAENCPSVLIKSCHFMDLAADFGGVVSVINSNPALLSPGSNYKRFFVVLNSHFEASNATKDGGAVYLSDASSWMENCLFEGNTATENGGGLQLLCRYAETSYYCNYTLVNVLLNDNHAEKGGGAYAYTVIKPWTSNVTGTGNTALYGNFRAGYPVTLRRIDSESKSVSAESGVVLTTNLTLGLFDLHEQLVTTEFGSPAVVASNTQSATLVGVTKQFPKGGLYSFDTFSVLDEPGSSVLLSFQSDSLAYNRPDPNSGLTPSPVSLTARLRLCVLGEIQVTSVCVECASGSYSFNTSDLACASCLGGMQCMGGAQVLTNPGYWRPSNTTDDIFRCPYEEPCLGGLNSDCDTGYEGRLCTVCSTTYLRLGKFQCAPCGSEAATITRGILIVIGSILLLIYIVYGALESAEKAKSPTGPLTRILLNYIQTFSLVISFNLRWPYQILKFTDGISLVGSGTSSSFSTSCLNSIEFGTTEVYLKLIFISILPIVMAGLALIVWGLVAIKKGSIRYIKDHFICTVIVILLALHPNVLSSALSMIACQEMEGSSHWLIADYNEECWKGDHAYYTISTALPAFLIWVVASPLIMLTALVKSRKYRDVKSVKVRYSFLFTGYKSEHFYWEFVILARKTCMLALQSTLASSALLVQVFATLMLLWVFFKIHLKMLPFIIKKLNVAEGLSILSVIVNTISGVLLTYDKSNSLTWELVIVALYFVSTCAFFGFWAVSIILTWKELLLKKFPWLIKFFGRTSKAVRPYSGTVLENELNEQEARRQPVN